MNSVLRRGSLATYFWLCGHSGSWVVMDSMSSSHGGSLAGHPLTAAQAFSKELRGIRHDEASQMSRAIVVLMGIAQTVLDNPQLPYPPSCHGPNVYLGVVHGDLHPLDLSSTLGMSTQKNHCSVYLGVDVGISRRFDEICKVPEEKTPSERDNLLCKCMVCDCLAISTLGL